MGLLNRFFSQTRKPEGILGKFMLTTMNAGHSVMADWGMGHLPQIESKAIVDLGCGAGRNAGELLKRCPKAKVTAIDYSPLSVEKARVYNSEAIAAGRCAVEEGNVADLKLPAATFDLATAFETVYFWPGLEACFAQVAKVLKPGGTFLIVNEADGEDATGKKFEKIIDGMKVYKAEEIQKALQSAGFGSTAAWHHPRKPWIAVMAIK